MLKRQSVCRWHELNIGFYVGRENPILDVKGEAKWQNHKVRVPMRETGADESVVVKKFL